MNTGEKIRQIRKMSGMTQEELAEKLNVSRQTISKWESGLSSPDLENAANLCSLFQISLDDLVKERQVMEKEEKITLQDMMKIHRRTQRMTIVMLSGLFFFVVGVLAAVFVLALRSTTLSMEYMLYRYIATGRYDYAEVDYGTLILPALLLILTGASLCAVFAWNMRREKKDE